MEARIKTDMQSNSQGNQVDNIRMNEQITNLQVRLINKDGENIGIVSGREAYAMAKEQGLDLVEIAKNGNMSVCKIIDAGKYKYALQKKRAEVKKGRKVIETKEIKLTPAIGNNDYEVKMRNIRRFLKDGDKVKVTLRFRGRELSYTDLGMGVINRVKTDLENEAKVEQQPKMEGRQISMVLVPLKA